MLSSESEVKNEIHLAFVGARVGMRMDRWFCCLSRRRIRDSHTSDFGRHLHHHAVV
jgi:hypothetical protein